jgi:hypothetical protein
VRLTVILLAIATISAAVIVRPAAAPAAIPGPPDAPQPPERSVVGTLDRVDAAATEIVVSTASGKQTFQLQSGATIRQGSKTIKPSELASHKGERLKVRYRESGGVRRAEWLVLAVPARGESRGR